jgi:hypothetical protein
MYAAGMTLKEENYSRSKKPLKNKYRKQSIRPATSGNIDAEINFADITQN